MTSDDDALASVVARGVAASSSWSLDEACARAVSGRHLDDVGGAIRDAAPCVLAVERWLASLPEGTPGATIVEICGSDSGHVAGMLLASILPPSRRAGGGAGRRAMALRRPLVLVVVAPGGARGHTAGPRDVSRPTHAVESHGEKRLAPPLAAPRAPRRHRRRRRPARRGVPSRAGDGCTPRHADVLRSRARTRRARPRTGRAPDRVAAINGKLLYRAGPSHTFTARQIYPREGRRRDRRRSARDVSSASASDSPERRFARHLAVASGGATENVDARPIVATRNAGDEVRTADDPFRPVALRVTDQMAEVNAVATTAAANGLVPVDRRYRSTRPINSERSRSMGRGRVRRPSLRAATPGTARRVLRGARRTRGEPREWRRSARRKNARRRRRSERCPLRSERCPLQSERCPLQSERCPPE